MSRQVTVEPKNGHEFRPLPAKKAGRVALVNMPWTSIRRGSIALGILKQSLARHNIPSDIHYLNVRLARLMKEKANLKAYEALSEVLLLGEWLFSTHLFGKFGTAELDNGAVKDLDDGTVLLLEETVDLKCETVTDEIIGEFIEESLEVVPWHQYDIVGFTSTFSQNVASLLMARKIKERYPNIKTVLGGANAQGPMGKAAISAFDWLDYVVEGEGEETFPELASNIINGEPYKPVRGVSYRRDGEVFLNQGPAPTVLMDSSPTPDYREYFAAIDEAGLTHQIDISLLFESSRGCWWGQKAHCTFCGLNGQAMKYRTKSAQRVMDEILDQSDRYKVLSFEAVDNIMDTDAFTELLPQLAERNIDLDLFYETKSSLNREQVNMLAAARVRYIQPGIESLHTDILKLMRKGVTAAQNIQLLKLCCETGIKPVWNLLYGFPGETREQYQEMAETLKLITHFHPPSNVIRIILQRFSPYFFDADRLGIREVKPMPIYNKIYPSKVNIGDIAYYFNYSLDQSQEDPEKYVGPLKKIYHGWARSFRSKKVFFRFRRGEGFIELIDNRPFDPKKEVGPVRRLVLDGLEAELYLYCCHSIRGFKDICQRAETFRGAHVDEQEVREILKKFVDDRLVFVEKERFLGLAVPASGRGR